MEKRNEDKTSKGTGGFRIAGVVEVKHLPVVYATAALVAVLGGDRFGVYDQLRVSDPATLERLESQVRECRQSEDKLAGIAVQCETYVQRAQKAFEGIPAEELRQIPGGIPLPGDVPTFIYSNRPRGKY